MSWCLDVWHSAAFDSGVFPPFFLVFFAWDCFYDGFQKPRAYTHHRFEIGRHPERRLFVFRPRMYCNYLVLILLESVGLVFFPFYFILFLLFYFWFWLNSPARHVWFFHDTLMFELWVSEDNKRHLLNQSFLVNRASSLPLHILSCRLASHQATNMAILFLKHLSYQALTISCPCDLLPSLSAGFHNSHKTEIPGLSFSRNTHQKGTTSIGLWLKTRSCSYRSPRILYILRTLYSTL